MSENTSCGPVQGPKRQINCRSPRTSLFSLAIKFRPCASVLLLWTTAVLNVVLVSALEQRLNVNVHNSKHRVQRAFINNAKGAFHLKGRKV